MRCTVFVIFYYCSCVRNLIIIIIIVTLIIRVSCYNSALMHEYVDFLSVTTTGH